MTATATCSVTPRANPRPSPAFLRGNPERTKARIDASRHQWTYRARVISFAAEDTPSEAQQVKVMDAFEQLAFAGLDSEQSDILWFRHSHEDRVELHFCTPRLELTTGRSLNIAPLGDQDAYDSLRDLMNQRHGWADPMEQGRAQEVRGTIEVPARVQGPDELHAWILDQISMGLNEDRASLLDALAGAGFNLPRVGKAYLTAQDPETGERWRLKGEVLHEDWQADPVERKAERGAGHDTPRLRASMASQLECFKTDLTAIASDARRTIESDTRCFLNENRSLFEARTEQIRRWLTISLG
ncbi:relaxase/mobilization nuclease domain-containing protein [Thalassorhabdomicrobium marinisediminis]|uniref:relaxase/mobilization nuclease domain-containing protein n=1 Tax=Thalassorhabdomicrobium marinisediminis TaxID=2170577 RepID=UPI001F53F506|nr:relaxase/mobilization nuclease domain-containing protein [Thalassorhabdomicrobium marinisediminis]